MEPHHRDLIKSNLQILLEKIEYDSILPLLVERGLFTKAMVADIEEPNNKEEKLLFLLQELPTRGPEAFVKFVRMLLDTDQMEAANVLDPDAMYEGDRPTSEFDAINNNASTDRVRIQEQSTGEISVRKATILRTGVKIYKMTSKPRGLCLLVNNVKFSDGDRLGSDVDLARADKTFIQLGFKVIIRSDLKCKDMFEELKKFSRRRDHADLDSTVVLIMTHGLKDVVLGVDDKPLSVSAIYNLFNNEACPALRGKPKMFFIQACRGVKVDYGVRENVSADAGLSIPEPPSIDPKPDPKEFRTIEDIIVVQSSAPDHKSFRNEVSGSWFVNSLTNVLIHHACDHHLIEIINEVDHRVKVRVGVQGQRQTTSFNSIGFNKYLYFNPGL